ncbi:MAG TPA: hypothetical protein VNN18_04520 [Candidatus Xenobia bacterium]|nr:hypothetical protein [Candidatus Xenobia bacterium]
MAAERPPPVTDSGEHAAGDRLDSWKEIAAYLNRDVRTVYRWEKQEALPVHRHAHAKRGTVYAYKHELDTWLRVNRNGLETREANRARSRRQRLGLAVAGVAATVILLVSFAAWLVPRFQEERPLRVVQLTTLPGLEDSPTWSPDGRYLAYASEATGNLDIYIQQIGTGQTVRLTESGADEWQPAWSPDGAHIAFVSSRVPQETLPTLAHSEIVHFSVLKNMWRWQPFFAGRNGDIWVMPALGGTPRRVVQDAYCPAWSPDGARIVYVAWRAGKWGLWVKDVDSPNEPRDLAVEASPPLGAMLHPAWSPDGMWIAFTTAGIDELQVHVVPSEGGQARAVTEANANALTPAWSPDGRWLFFSSDRGGTLNLWKVRFEDGRFDSPQQVTVGSGDDLQPRPAPHGARVAYSTMRNEVDLWEHDLVTGEASRLTSETTIEDHARPSPDGTRVAFTSNRLGESALWVLNRQTGSLTRVGATTSHWPSRWSSDGRYLFYTTSSLRGEERTLWQYELGSATSQKVYEGVWAGDPSCLLADGKYMVTGDNRPPRSINRVELASGRREVLAWVATDHVTNLSCSADGEWIAFHAQQGDDSDIWVVPSAGGAARQLTFGDKKDAHPVWSPDSRLIYFVRDHRDIYVVPRTGGEPGQVTNYKSPRITVDYPAATADGRRLIFTRNERAGDLYLLESRPD